MLSSNERGFEKMSTFDAKIQPAIGGDFPAVVVPLFNAAGHKIDVLMYEWKWYTHEAAGGVEKFNLAIQAAARRGVKVRVLLNIESMGHAITKINSRTATYLQMAGCEVKFGQIGVATHAKMFIIDDRILVLGSHNISKGSFSRNQEASIVVEGGEAIRAYIDYFRILWDHTF
jgi:phosphatidylserine/phosphatidylglycerophosphate/cardiolipin synthase-like enzyme